MNNNEVTIIRTNIEAQLRGATVAPIVIAGEPGTAKSTSVALIAEAMGADIHIVSLPSISHENFTGIPEFFVDLELQEASKDGSEIMATKWSMPEVIADTNRKALHKPTILLLDDLAQMPQHLQAYLFRLLLERSIGNYKLFDNVAIVLTTNDSEAAGFGGINSAVRNRLAILQVKFDFNYWFEGFGKNLHYLVASFLKAKPSYVTEEESTGIEGFATPRAWTQFASELEHHEISFITSNAALLASTQMSKSTSVAFAKHVAYVAAIDFTKVAADKTLVVVAEGSPIDSILYSYIVNFIESIADGIYLLKLMDHNHSDRSFIGFLLGELYNLYKQEDKRTDGIQLVIDKLLGVKLDKAHYTTTAELTKARKASLKYRDELFEIASDYLI